MVRSHLSLRTRILAPVLLVGALATSIALSIVYTVQKDVETEVLGELSALSDLHVAHSLYATKVYRRVIDFWEIDSERMQKASDDMRTAIEEFIAISSQQRDEDENASSREDTNQALETSFQSMTALGTRVFEEANELNELTEEMEDQEQEWRARVEEMETLAPATNPATKTDPSLIDLFSSFEEMNSHVFDYFSETREYVDSPSIATQEEIDEALEGFQNEISNISFLIEGQLDAPDIAERFQKTVQTIEEIIDVTVAIRQSRIALQDLVAQHQSSSEAFDRTIQMAIGLVSHDARTIVSDGFTTIALLIIAASAATTLAVFVPLTSTVQRISRLNETAQSFGSGNFTARSRVQQVDEVGQFIITFNTMADQLERSFAEQRQLQEKAELANRAKSDFLASMSHELRTPLNAIAGFTNIMRMGLFGAIENDRYKKYLDDIQYSAEHVIEMIGELLELARAEGGHIALNPEELQASDIGQRVVDLCSKNASDASVSLRLVIDATHSLEADRRAVVQMLLNLVANAIKFSPAGNEVILRTVETNDTLVFEVKDTGVGIPEDKLDSVLAPYYQTDNPMIANTGVGLGLALTRELVELHKGSIMLESTVGVGTIARIILPKVFNGTVKSGRDESTIEQQAAE